MFAMKIFTYEKKNREVKRREISVWCSGWLVAFTPRFDIWHGMFASSVDYSHGGQMNELASWFLRSDQWAPFKNQSKIRLVLKLSPVQPKTMDFEGWIEGKIWLSTKIFRIYIKKPPITATKFFFFNPIPQNPHISSNSFINPFNLPLKSLQSFTLKSLCLPSSTS